MSTVEITCVEDVRVGDVVTMADKYGGTYTGPTRHSETLGAVFGPLGWAVDHHSWTFVRATREVPGLPTEPESVIVNATIRGEAGHTAFLSDDGAWRSLRLASGYYFHDPEHVTAWEPARIVPESEVGRTGVEVES